MAQMSFQFLDVGMGDGTLVIMGDDEAHQQLALIDFGETRSKNKVGRDDALKYLVTTIDTISKARKLPAPYIDHLFITHPHKDHYNAIPRLVHATYPSYLFQNLAIGELSYGGPAYLYGTLIKDLAKFVNKTNGQFPSCWRSKVGVPYRTFPSGIKVYVLNVNYPISQVKNDINQLSLCLMFEDQANNRVILMGDAEWQVEQQIVDVNFKDAKSFLKAYALKLGHHGSEAGTSAGWLAAVQPKAVFASSDIVWAHPYCNTIKRVEAANSLATLGDHWYNCGESIKKEGREYFNKPTKLQIFVNLWYTVKVDPGEWMKERDASDNDWFQQGTTLGVQWGMTFDGVGRPTITVTDIYNPVKSPVKK
jgi:beta-lactamase superfamily II metal-dependent hydrolase